MSGLFKLASKAKTLPLCSAAGSALSSRDGVFQVSPGAWKKGGMVYAELGATRTTRRSHTTTASLEGGTGQGDSNLFQRENEVAV